MFYKKKRVTNEEQQKGKWGEAESAGDQCKIEIDKEKEKDFVVVGNPM